MKMEVRASTVCTVIYCIVLCFCFLVFIFYHVFLNSQRPSFTGMLCNFFKKVNKYGISKISQINSMSRLQRYSYRTVPPRVK